MIRAGDADVVVAGGMENMTRSPYLVPAARFGARTGDAEVVDSMVHDGLWDAVNDIHMGVTAENLADQYGIGRDEQDEFAADSQQRAERAVADGVFKEEIVLPVKDGTRIVDNDEHPRPGETAAALSELRAAFCRDGATVTAGNASGVNDGAAAIVVMSARRGRERGLRTFGTVESHASVGVEPKIMGIGPVPAVRKALTRAGLELADIDLFELNEAFAAQSIAVLRELDIDIDRINPHGGAIALGYPIGASGGRILVTLLQRDAPPKRRARPCHALRRRRPGTVGGHPQRNDRPRDGAAWRSPAMRSAWITGSRVEDGDMAPLDTPEPPTALTPADRPH